MEREMAQETDKKLINILRKAINSERTAYKRYSLAESLAESKDEKKIYKSLAEEELKHEEILMGRFRELKKVIGLGVIKKDEKVETAPKKKKAKKKKEEAKPGDSK